MISVAIATYNGAKYLREQLDSLYSQTLVPDEIVVSDDGSSDGTLDILEEYAHHKGLLYFKNTEYHGVNGNFYNAFLHSSGDYICICDQDDIWLPSKIETLYKTMKTIPRNQYGIVSSRTYDVDYAGNIIGKDSVFPNSRGYIPTFLSTGTSQGCTIMMNRAMCNYILAHKDCPEVSDLIYDAFISFSAAMIGQKENLGDKLMLYRHHSSNVICQYKDPKTSKRFDFRNYWTYYGFMPDDRPDAIIKVYEVVKNDISDIRIHEFVSHIIEFQNESSSIRRLKTICTINELSIKRKISIVANTVFWSFVKRVF